MDFFQSLRLSGVSTNRIKPELIEDFAINEVDMELLSKNQITVLDLTDELQKEVAKFSSVKNHLKVLDHEIKENWDTSKFVWAFYPWRKSLIKIPDQNVFETLRTIRNKFKILPGEQATLRTKKVGIIGLSVGHSVAIPLALERICGTIRLADYDNLELSNLNRIASSILDIGKKKVHNTARQLSEIDPFLNLECFENGITAENIEEFLLGSGKLDLVIEECDSGDIKLLTRILCRKHRIPVIMETSDRGLLDIERFDLEPNRPLLHGMLNEHDFRHDLTAEEKRLILLKSIDFDKVSERGAASMTEIGKSITNWPQLGTDVIAGGATAAMAAKLILLGEAVSSGRRYVDIQSIIRRNPEEDPTFGSAT